MGLEVIWHLPPPLCLGIAHGSALTYLPANAGRMGRGGRAWQSASLPNGHSLNEVADRGVCPGTGLLYSEYQI